MKDASMLGGLIADRHESGLNPVRGPAFKNVVLPAAVACFCAMILGFAVVNLWAVLAAAYDLFTGAGHQ